MTLLYDDDNETNEVELLHEDDNDDIEVDYYDEDSDSSDEPIYLRTRAQRKIPETSSDNDTNDVDDRLDVTIEESVAQEIERQSDDSLFRPANWTSLEMTVVLPM